MDFQVAKATFGQILKEKKVLIELQHLLLCIYCKSNSNES
jgi:hypothetical protein